MKKPIQVIILSLLFILTGCESKIVANINLSDLMNEESKEFTGEVYVEIPSCSSFKDSRKPSDSLVKAHDIMPKIFPNAKYIECFKKKFDTYARFSIPLCLDKVKDNKFESDSSINLVSIESVLLGISIPDLIKNNINILKENEMLASQIKISFQIIIHNDTGEDQTFNISSSYVDDKPCIFGEMMLKQGQSTSLVLSDVSTSLVLQGASVAPILTIIQK